jgi:hypothetical protein
MPRTINIRTKRNRYATGQYDPIASPKQIALLERLVEERVMTEQQANWYLVRIAKHRNQSDPYQVTKVDIKKWFGNAESGKGLFAQPLKEGYDKDHFKAFEQAPFGATTREAESERFNREWAEHKNEFARREAEQDQAALEAEPDVPEIIVPRRGMRPARIGIYVHNDNVYVVRKRRGSDRVTAFRLVESPPRLAANGKTVHHDWERDYRMVWVLTEEERVTDDDAIRELNIKVGACVMCNHAIWQAKSVRRMMGTRCYKRVHGLI